VDRRIHRGERLVSPIVNKVLLGAVCVTFGLAAGTGYGSFMLRKERSAHERVAGDLEKKVAQVQQGLREEKSRTSTIEGQNRTLQSEMAKLKQQNGSLGAAAKELEDRLQSSAEQVKQLARQEASARSDTAAVEKRCAELCQAQVNELAKRCESAVQQMNGQKQALEAALKKVKEDLGRSFDDNRELCSIARDILDRVESRGSFAKLSEKEPITQLRRVELEKLIQDYGKKIDQKAVKPERPQ
jgi:chromosome segregation ATPase